MMNKESDGVGGQKMKASGEEMHGRSNFEEGMPSKPGKLEHLNLLSVGFCPTAHMCIVLQKQD